MTPHPKSPGERFAESFRANAAHLEAAGLYDPAEEHDACGVGFVAAIDGKPRRAVVEAGINALKAVWHRGAVDADGKTGDGAGIHVEVPQDFFREHIKHTGHEPGPGQQVAYYVARSADQTPLAFARVALFGEFAVLFTMLSHLDRRPAASWASAVRTADAACSSPPPAVARMTSTPRRAPMSRDSEAARLARA